MRGAVAYNEALFSTVRLEDFVPAKHPLRPIRQWVNDALEKMDAESSAVCEADIKGGRPRIAPETLTRAMLQQVLDGIRSERQLVEQIQHNLPFRCFVGLAIEDSVWDHSVFSKSRDRLVAHDAVTELFDAMVAMAGQRGLLPGGRLSVDGALIQAWASRKSMRREVGYDDDRPPEDWRGEPRSNGTRESRSDPPSRLYRKSNAAPALPSCPGHVLTDRRHALVVKVQARAPDGTTEREVAAQMPADAKRPGQRATAGADKACDTRSFGKAWCAIGVTPHVAQNTNCTGGSAIDARTTRHVGCAVSQRKSKCIEQCFGRGRGIGPIRQVTGQVPDKVDQRPTQTMAACRLTRLRSLAQLRPQCVQ